jgi:hypothetical protein
MRRSPPSFIKLKNGTNSRQLHEGGKSRINTPKAPRDRGAAHDPPVPGRRDDRPLKRYGNVGK